MYYNYFDSPVGFLEFSFCESKLYTLMRVDKITKPSTETDFARKVKKQLSEYFDKKRKVFELDFVLKGTPFQEKVWGELLKIPYGQRVSYKDIATAIGNAKASRPVGSANGKNPLMIIVPCHRVVSANGTLNGYACGSAMKEFLLELES